MGPYWGLCPHLLSGPGPCQLPVRGESCFGSCHVLPLHLSRWTAVQGGSEHWASWKLKACICHICFFLFAKTHLKPDKCDNNVYVSRTPSRALIQKVGVKKEWILILTAGLIQRFKCLTMDPSRTSGIKEDKQLQMG